jgi:uncharacterized protein YqfA (UPF0365 family)
MAPGATTVNFQIANFQIILVLLPVGMFLIVLAALFTLARNFAPWIQASTSGVHLSVLQIIGMRLRNTDVQAVLRALVEPHHSPRNVQTWHCRRRHGRVLGT